MLRLRQLLARPPKLIKPPDDLVRAGTYTPNLPAELWLQIIGHLKDSTDIYNLSQVSSTLRALSLSTFKTLNLFPPEPATSAQIRSLGFRILCALQTPALACIVKDLSVTLSCFQVRGSAPRNCACDSLDRALGLALRAMTNLEALDILCIMCVRSVNGRHAYLDTPDAPGQHVTQLRTLSFRCRCCTYTPPTHPNTFESPLFNNVETLRWMTGTRLPALPGGSQFEGLPQLKALAYYGRVVENSLLEARPIQRLYVVDLYRSRARFIRALEVSAKSLTHVIYENLVGLKDILDEKRRSYPNVCHIGTLPAFPVNETNLIESHLAPYAYLKLTSVDATVVDGRNPWNEEVLSRLCKVHRDLSKVFIQGDKFYVWELRGETWEIRAVPQFSSWDIIRGVCDRM